jgi:hypothetical protein
MKQNKMLIVFLLMTFSLQAQFVDFTETTSKNRFLGLDMNSCSTSGGGSINSYECGNDTISELLNVNFLSPELLGQQFYIYNNFMYWMTGHDGMGQWDGSEKADAKRAAQARANPDKNFSGTGVFMIIVGTSSYLQQMVAPDKKCPDGQILLAAQLKYNDGNSLTSWSQDAICLLPNEMFEIAISQQQDNTVPPADAAAKPNKVADVDDQSIDWMKDNGPADNYALADSSPRKVRLYSKGSGRAVTNQNNIVSIVQNKKAPATKKPKKSKK